MLWNPPLITTPYWLDSPSLRVPERELDGLPFAEYRRGAPLLVLEVRHMIDSIGQLHDELATRASPTHIGFPGVDVLIRARIVSQGGPASRDGRLDIIQRRAGATVELLGDGIARREDVQPLIPIQPKLHRDGLPGHEHVQYRRVADRWE